MNEIIGASAFLLVVIAMFGYLSLLMENGAQFSKPVMGWDAHWLESCDFCKGELVMHASRGGYREGGTKHCYSCGAESLLRIPCNATRHSMVNHSLSHWLGHPRIPYNWHRLTEEQRFAILEGR